MTDEDRLVESLKLILWRRDEIDANDLRLLVQISDCDPDYRWHFTSDLRELIADYERQGKTREEIAAKVLSELEADPNRETDSIDQPREYLPMTWPDAAVRVGFFFAAAVTIVGFAWACAWGGKH